VIHVVHLIGSAAVWVALVASVAFCALYAAVAPWWRSGEGRHLMTFTAVIGIAFGWIAFRMATGFGAQQWLEMVRAAILGALAVLLVWRLLMLIRAQIRRRRR
jgi:hypothetical protein